MSVTVTTYGDIRKAIEDGNEAAILKLVTRVTAQAKSLAPVDTGQLRGSIMGRVIKGDIGHNEGPTISQRPKSNEGYVGTAVLHGIYQEFGTRRTNAQPYLRPAIAIEANGVSATKAVKDAQLDSVKKATKGPKKSKVYQ